MTDEKTAKKPARTNDPREGHRERLKTKFLTYGLEKLTDEEVVELLLTFGTPRKDCKTEARALLTRFGTIREVLEAPPALLTEVPGVGPSSIVALKLIHAVAGRYLELRLQGRDYMNSSAQVMEYLRHHLESRDQEVLKVFYLNHDNVILSVEDLSLGSLTLAQVYNRQVIERAIQLKSTALVLAHNHPGGNPQPSEDDYRLTFGLMHATVQTEITVLDHLVIGRNGKYYSFKDAGLIQRYEKAIRDNVRTPPRGAGGSLHEGGLVAFDTVAAKISRRVDRAAARVAGTRAPAVGEPDPEFDDRGYVLHFIESPDNNDDGQGGGA